MNKTKPILAFSIFLLGALPVHAGIQAESAPATAPSPWDGAWQDSNGALMTVREHNGFLDVLGKDRASTYSAVCLVDSDTNEAECVGEGMNHIGDFRFLYRSTMSLDPSGEISETWKASSASGEEEGKATFQRIGEAMR